MNRSRICSLVFCVLMVGCANPYLAQMDALEADYRAGRVSRSEYDREMESLRIRSNQWNAQSSANAALGASAITAAAIVGGSLIQAEATEDLAHAVSGSHKGGGGKGRPDKPDKPSGGKGKKNDLADGPPGVTGGPPVGSSAAQQSPKPQPLRVPDPPELKSRRVPQPP